MKKFLLIVFKVFLIFNMIYCAKYTQLYLRDPKAEARMKKLEKTNKDKTEKQTDDSKTDKTDMKVKKTDKNQIKVKK